MSLLKLFAELEVAEISYDPQVDAAYISLGGKGRNPGTVKKTHPVDHGIICDFDEEGNILGIEILWVRDQIRKWVNAPKPEDPGTLNADSSDVLIPVGERKTISQMIKEKGMKVEISANGMKVIKRRFE